MASEEHEFAGLLRRGDEVARMAWPVACAYSMRLNGNRWLLAADGSGPSLAARASTSAAVNADMILSIGLCGALDPELNVNDIVGDHPLCPHFGAIHSVDRFIHTAAAKRVLRAETGALAVDMESSAIKAHAAAAVKPFFAIRAVSDTAREDFRLDFNAYRDSEGRFSRPRLVLGALRHPRAIPDLIRLGHRSKTASEALGEFLANCRF